MVEPGCVYHCRANGHCALKRLGTYENIYKEQTYVKKRKKDGKKVTVATDRKDYGFVGIAMDMVGTKNVEATVVSTGFYTFLPFITEKCCVWAKLRYKFCAFAYCELLK